MWARCFRNRLWTTLLVLRPLLLFWAQASSLRHLDTWARPRCSIIRQLSTACFSSTELRPQIARLLTVLRAEAARLLRRKQKSGPRPRTNASPSVLKLDWVPQSREPRLGARPALLGCRDGCPLVNSRRIRTLWTSTTCFPLLRRRRGRWLVEAKTQRCTMPTMSMIRRRIESPIALEAVVLRRKIIARLLGGACCCLRQWQGLVLRSHSGVRSGVSTSLI